MKASLQAGREVDAIMLSHKNSRAVGEAEWYDYVHVMKLYLESGFILDLQVCSLRVYTPKTHIFILLTIPKLHAESTFRCYGI